MARKSLISQDVINSDRYLGMSLEARELYPHLLVTNADPIGTVSGISGVARLCGYQDPTPIIEELVSNGYLVDAQEDDGETVYFISHWFALNNKDRARQSRSQHMSLAESTLNDVQAGYRYREEKPSTVEEKPSTVEDSRATNPQPLRKNPPNVMECNVTESNGMEGNEKEGKGRGSAKGEPLQLPCPQCKSTSTTVGQERNGCVQVECMACGNLSWFDRETGEFRDDPFPGQSRR